jgi:hypothetical protein
MRLIRDLRKTQEILKGRLQAERERRKRHRLRREKHRLRKTQAEGKNTTQILKRRLNFPNCLGNAPSVAQKLQSTPAGSSATTLNT